MEVDAIKYHEIITCIKNRYKVGDGVNESVRKRRREEC
jgi:hypothetical protein